MMTPVIAPGDLVRCSHSGRLFHALVRAVRGERLSVAPLERGVVVKSVRLDEVVDHWAHQPKPVPAVAPGQRTLADLWDR